MKIHFDACVAVRIARAIRELESRENGPIISIHEEEFEEGTLDVDWLVGVKSRGIKAIVTADDKIRRNPDERRAWLQSDSTLYVLSDKFASSKGWAQVREAIRWWEHMMLHLKTAQPRTVWSLPWDEKKPRQLSVLDDRE